MAKSKFASHNRYWFDVDGRMKSVMATSESAAWEIINRNNKNAKSIKPAKMERTDG